MTTYKSKKRKWIPYQKTPIVYEKFDPSTVKFTEEQSAILEHFKQEKPGNLAVAALPGTGKTFITTRAIELVASLFPLLSLLYVVFGKKNEREVLPKISVPCMIKTLSALGYFHLKNFWGKLLLDDLYNSFDKIEYARIKRIAGDDIAYPVMLEIEKLIGFAKSYFVNPSDDDLTALCLKKGIDVAPKFQNQFPTSRLVEIAQGCLELSRKNAFGNRCNFGDIVWLPVALGICKPIADRIWVDEAQDMSDIQLQMVFSSLKPGGFITIVGDDNQGIYSFRGACLKAMEKYTAALQAKSFPLTVTFRCGKAIVEHNKNLMPDYKAGDSNHDGEVVSMNLETALPKVKVNDAILSRVNAPLLKICFEFLKQGKPARVEGKDIGYKLKSTIKKVGGSNVSEFLTNLETWQTTRLAKLTSWNSANEAEFIQDTCACLRTLADNCNTIAAMESKITDLFTDTENNPRPSIVCSSIHKAKGLEWTNTYLLLDSFVSNRQKDTTELEEEKHLWIVGQTRAKHTLALVSGLTVPGQP